MAGIRQRLVERYRLTGADVPFGDPLPSHRTEMEGWFWRVTEPSTGRAIVALCSVNRHPAGDWSTTAVALHPGASCGRAHSTVPSRPIRRSRYPRARVRRPSPRAPTGWTSASTICISGWSSAIRSRGPRRSPVAASSPRSRTSISTGIRTAWVDGPPVRSNSQGIGGISPMRRCMPSATGVRVSHCAGGGVRRTTSTAPMCRSRSPVACWNSVRCVVMWPGWWCGWAAR